MSVPFGVFFDPVAQTDAGIAALDASEFYVSALAVITFGFLVGNFWAYCDVDATTSWSAVADEVTTWTPVADETTTWSDC